MEEVMNYVAGEPSSTQRSFPSIDEEVVGFEDDAEIIKQKLTGGTKELDVVSIFGMAGLGKTSLTRKVYNNPSIVTRFDVHVWCAVSQKYNVRKLFAEILKQTTRGTGEINEDDDDIADKVRKSLIGRRYLIVLDDMWEVEAWEDLKLSFPNGDNGSRVMVTTRVEKVANQLKHFSDPYPLRFLTEEESWALLKKRVFRGENSCTSDLLEAGQQVAKHCKGLPLVIVLIAGIISNMEKQASLWLEVANDLSSHILGEQAMKAIQSSYGHLESHLKPPLLYVAYYFPEDKNIPVSDLLEYWMAEELVHNFDSGDMQEKAESAKVCLNELVNRSLVMVSKRRAINGDMKCCMLHDVVREFCLRKLTEENFTQHILPYNPYHEPLDNSRESRLCLYISLYDLLQQYNDEEAWSINIMKEKKSLDQCFDHLALQFVLPPLDYHPSHVVKLKFIRVLNFIEEMSSSSLVEALKSTNHLRYLELRVFDSPFDFEWVSHLCHLQTLKIDSRIHIRTSIAPFWKMDKLSHVDITGFSFIWEEKDIVANFNNNSSCGTPMLLKNLKFFGRYHISMVDMIMQFWNRFPNLEKFSIFFEDVEFENTTISPFPGQDNIHLQSLRASYSFNCYRKNRERELSSAYLFPINLKDLRLQDVVIMEDMLSSIASLPNLEHLRIINGFYGWETCWDLGDNKFPALKHFKLQDTPILHELLCSEETFPVLERLVIKRCEDLEEIPSCFADIPTLKLIKVIGCRDSVRESALNIKKEVEDMTGCDSLQVLVESGFTWSDTSTDEEEDIESEEE